MPSPVCALVRNTGNPGDRCDAVDEEGIRDGIRLAGKDDQSVKIAHCRAHKGIAARKDVLDHAAATLHGEVYKVADQR